MIASIAQGLHLSLDERDHLFRLAGHHPPVREAAGDHVEPGMLRIFDRLADTPAEIVTELGETLRQTPLERRARRRLHPLDRPVPQHRLPLVHRSGVPAPAPAGGPRALLADVRRRAARRARRAVPIPGPRTWPTCCSTASEEFRHCGPRTRSGSGPTESSATSTPQSGPSS